MKDQHEFPNLIIEYRKLQKILKYIQYIYINSTYINGYNDSCREFSDGSYHIYSHWNQINTSTGRLSSCNPNIQNMPSV